MNNIRKIRVERGLKQVELSKLVGLSAATISYYENGIKKPTIKNAFKLSNVLNVTVDELFSEKAELTKERR